MVLQPTNQVLFNKVPQSPLEKDEFEVKPVLDMKGIPAGNHSIKVELYEL
jgi:hypothetical protein